MHSFYSSSCSSSHLVADTVVVHFFNGHIVNAKVLASVDLPDVALLKLDSVPTCFPSNNTDFRSILLGSTLVLFLIDLPAS
jgi:S1-C subfamily serine protease